MNIPEYNAIDILKILARKQSFNKMSKIIRCIYLPLLIIIACIWCVPKFNITLSAILFLWLTIFIEMILYLRNNSYFFTVYHKISQEMKWRKKCLSDDDSNKLWHDEKKKDLALVINRICIQFAAWDFDYKFLPGDSFPVMTGSVQNTTPDERCVKAIEKILNINFPQPEELRNISFGQLVDNIYTDEATNASNTINEEDYCRITKYKFKFWHTIRCYIGISVFTYLGGTLGGCTFYYLSGCLTNTKPLWDWVYIWGPLFTVGVYWVFGLLIYVIVLEREKVRKNKSIMKSQNSSI